MKGKILLIPALLSACTMAPKYVQPKADVPFVENELSTKEKISKISWQQFFSSPDLQRVINLALEKNRDLKIANLNIESSRAAHNIAIANLLPTINATGSTTRQGVPGAFASFSPKKQFRANLNTTSYEIDFFGRLQSLKESAYQEFLATQEARGVMKITIISETVNAYAQVLLDKKNLEIAKENAEAYEEKYRLSQLRYDNGIDSKSTLLTAQATYENANASYENYKKLLEQDQNALMILTGEFDEKSLPKEASLEDVEINEELLDFVPSKSLLSRPDIKQAEYVLKSANADIGAARAAFFPTISLTGTYGYSSRELKDLFNSKFWNFTPQINLPIFSGGRNFANLKIADLQKKIEIINYEKAIQTAFREARDQLAERESVVKQLKSYNKILDAREKYFEISQKRREQGIDNAADVLDAKIILLQAKQSQVNAKRNYLVNLVNLYKVMGGGSETN